MNHFREMYEIVTATCPGFSLEAADWKGCGVDARLTAEKRERHSSAWKEALDIVDEEEYE